MTIGLVGLGRMGAAIAKRLRASGRDVIAWDRRSAAADTAREAGAEWAGSPREVAERCDTVISIISEDDGVRQIFSGPRGFLEGPVSQKLFIEMSTLQPMTSRQLAPMVAANGGRFVEAPVLGTIPNVGAGELVALAAGDEKDVAQASQVLQPLARRVIYMGPHGSGYAMKLCVNLGLGAYVQALAEALALGGKQGLAFDQMIDVLKDSIMGTPFLQAKLPVLRGADGPISLDIKTMRKDLMSIVATGTLTGVPMPLAAGALSSFTAAVAAGAGDRDLAEIVRVLRERMQQDFNR